VTEKTETPAVASILETADACRLALATHGEMSAEYQHAAETHRRAMTAGRIQWGSDGLPVPDATTQVIRAYGIDPAPRRNILDRLKGL